MARIKNMLSSIEVSTSCPECGHSVKMVIKIEETGGGGGSKDAFVGGPFVAGTGGGGAVGTGGVGADPRNWQRTTRD